MKIFYWLADTQGCGYFRCLLPAHALVERGHQVAYNEILPGWVKEPDAVDVLVAQRTCNEGPTKTWQELARREDRPKLVFEVDDDLWHIDPSNKQAAGFYTSERLERLTANVRVADVVTVSTEPLADVVSQWNDNVHVVPNQIPAWLLEHERPASSAGLTVIGWRGGASHGRDFGEIVQPLRRFLQHPAYRDRVEFHCMGENYISRVVSRNAATRNSTWLPVTADFLRAVDFDISVVPLRESAFNNSKSDLALLEMSALGITAVTTSTGPYAASILRPAAPVHLSANSPAEWTSVLRELADDDEYRVQLGKQAREWAAGRTVEGNVHRWEDAYEG